MTARDVLVIGGGISGLAFAWHAARAGRHPLVLEAATRLGGCLDSRRGPDGYWFELGAHTLYNSYGGLLEIAQGSPRPVTIVARTDARKKFGRLHRGALSTMGPLSVFAKLGLWELLTHAPALPFRSKKGKTTREHWSAAVGARNYRELLAPFLSAVPSQLVDDFPADGPGSLFKKRARRKDVVKSFTFAGGTGAIVDAVTSAGVEAEVEARVTSLARTTGGWAVELDGGRRLEAPTLALAVDPATAARLVATVEPALAAALAPLKTVEIESVAVVTAKAAATLPELAFVVPTDDVFWSAVTRDPVPDDRRRAFTFHFKPGLDRATRLRRIAEVLAVDEQAFEVIAERRTLLPSTARDHAATVAAIDRALTATPGLAVTGNFFAGLAIEDCVLRSKAEWTRVAAAAAAAGTVAA
jgi:UDP-galactopyranose mutase